MATASKGTSFERGTDRKSRSRNRKLHEKKSFEEGVWLTVDEAERP